MTMKRHQEKQEHQNSTEGVYFDRSMKFRAHEKTASNIAVCL